MDPNATYTLYRAALRAKSIDLAVEYAGYLADWLSAGGFPPAALRNPRMRAAFDAFVARYVQGRQA